ncbi:hypothetical protein VNO77_18026 [Canavalia gladiata]|uniref:Uncharacterized protein n=1 Tax=Canavalia gladiata TaxID=3824 RepID=A0AAN9LK01_CANGL
MMAAHGLYWLRSSLLEKQGTCKSLSFQKPLNPLHVLPFSNTDTKQKYGVRRREVALECNALQTCMQEYFSVEQQNKARGIIPLNLSSSFSRLIC